MKTEEKVSKKKSKALKIVLIIVAAIVIVAVGFINLTTLPKYDDDKNVIYVGSMVKSKTIDYHDESGKGIAKNPIVKIMQMVWRFCDDGDKSKHAKQNPPKDIELISDIPYIDDGNYYHKLDIMYPNSISKGDQLPVIIDIHGGGWMYGDKGLNENYCRALADKGYVVFDINYRLVPDVNVNEQIKDVMSALKWIGENINNYPCDSDNIMLTGDSAGGMLASYASVLLQSEELRNIFETESADINLTALVLTSPVSYMKDGGWFSIYTKPLWGKGYKNSKTYEYMDFDKILPFAKEMPPTYLITSSGDTLAQKQTVKLYNLLKKNGVSCELANYGKEYGKSLPHVFSVLQPFEPAGKDAIDKELAFYKNAMKEKVK
ncbi:MAG: alpha/beta hydrolase [Eubacteriales bacterium]|nr:alpha/beta hydrolase [Eubacteriales bacterium]